MGTLIRVELLGGLHVWAGDTSIAEPSATKSDAWRLFCYLALHPGAAVPGHCLLAALWPKQPQQSALAQKTAQALCREWGATESGAPVVCEKDAWQLNPAIEWWIDTAALERKAQAASKAGGEEKEVLFARVLALYKGPLLPTMAAEAWLLPLAAHTRQIFVDCASAFCAFLQQGQRYNELVQAASETSALEPLEESLYVYLFRALDALKMYKAVIPVYHRVAGILMDELGALPCREMQDIYAEATAHLDAIGRDVVLIRQELDLAAGQRPLDGPLFCSYDVFKYLYQMMARTAERTGCKAAVLLLTLQAGIGGLYPTARITSQGLHQLQALLTGLLRKSDMVARYSRNQLLLMLCVDKPASLRGVAGRIAEAAQPALDALDLDLVFTDIEPMG